MRRFFPPAASALLLVAALLLPSPATSQVMTIEEYDPVSTLVVPEHIVTRAKYPFVDVHSHQWNLPSMDLDSLITAMDSLNMAVLVHLSGRGIDLLRNPQKRDAAAELAYLKASLENVRKHYPNRVVIFTNISYVGIDDPDWGERMARQVESDVKLGVKGLKIYKDLGLTVKDGSGKRVPVDDPRLDPIWAKCGELGIPVLIHSADPAPFWRPRDKYNERWLELKLKPERYRDPNLYPPWEQIIREQHNVFRKHPETVFINAHLGWLGNDLARLGKLLDECPNVYAEMGAVLYELGRQPRFARQWLIQYQDRILFGKDITLDLSEYHVYFRVLETADDYFKYYRRRHAFWRMYGLDLPDEVLRKIYYKNALRIIPGLDRSLFPQD